MGLRTPTVHAWAVDHMLLAVAHYLGVVRCLGS